MTLGRFLRGKLIDEREAWKRKTQKSDENATL